MYLTDNNTIKIITELNQKIIGYNKDINHNPYLFIVYDLLTERDSY